MQMSYYNPTTLHDLLMNTLLGFVLLFTVAILLINPTAGMKTKAEFVVYVTWADKCDSDVDTWLEDPTGKIAHFRQKDINLMHLDRDDLGRSNDVVYVNGRKIEFIYNEEKTSIRGFIAGEWVLNIHLYNKKEWKEPVKVNVRIDRLNPVVQTIFTKEIILNTTGEEVTVTRFTMTADGQIVEWDDTPKKLIQMVSPPN
jgi:hypothetical protein